MLVAVMSLLLLSCVAPSVAAAVCNAGDKKILLSLKQSLGNPTRLSSWKENTDCCATWGYVECDEDGRVSGVNIGPISTPGTLPDSIGGLTALVELTIRKCNLSGPIPPSIGNLRSLSVLQLERNRLTGPIPKSVGQLSSLVFLSLSQNNLSGPIPPSLGSLYNVQELYLDANQLSGPVPASLGNLAPQRVNISMNKLSGDVSALITGWASAVTIDISHNNFSFDLGCVRFPAGLTIFFVSHNHVYGTIPESANGMKGLEQFDVSRNRLCGQIPQGGVVSKFPTASFDCNICLCDSPMVPCLQLNCPLICTDGGARPLPSSSSVQASR